MPEPDPVLATTVQVVPLPVTEATLAPEMLPVDANAKSAVTTGLTAPLNVTVQDAVLPPRGLKSASAMDVTKGGGGAV